MSKNLTVCIFILVITLNANAGFLDNKLTVYHCKNNESFNCGKDCTKTDAKVEFLLNKDDKTILRKMYLDGRVDSSVFQKCKIFNDKNWDCSERSETSSKGRIVISNNSDKMVDGVYQSKSFIEIYSKNFETRNNLVNFCAK
jgi:hypothetical protein